MDATTQEAAAPLGDSEVDKDVGRLFSDQVVVIKGETITVREFRYLEGLRAAAIARPFIAGLRKLIEDLGNLEPEAILALIGENSEVWGQLGAISTGRPIEWLSELTDEEGMDLTLKLWEANKDFFTRRLILGAALKRGLEDLSRSRRSSRTSSTPGSAATTEKSASG